MDSFLTPYGLSNSGQEKLQFTPFWGGSKPGCSDGLGARIIESHNFFVLGPILVKFHIRTWLIESFPTTFRTWWCTEEKLRFTPVHTLHQLKHDEALFHHFGRSQSFERGTVRKLHAGLGLGQIWTAFDSCLRKNSASHVFWLVQTCRNLFEPVRNTVTMYAPSAVIFCTFKCSYSLVLRPILVKLHISARLMERFPMVYE